MPQEKGLLIVYTGPGKGKTTCALGAAFRAVGQGMRVLMAQFIKGSWHYGELDSAKMLGDDKFEIRPMGRGFVKIGGAETDPEDIKLAEECWQTGRDAIYSEKYDLVILDEINYVISYKMLEAEMIVEALRDRPERIHVICTGRNAHPKLVELADLVTEMKEVKHPYTKGILAQRGIDYYTGRTGTFEILLNYRIFGTASAGLGASDVRSKKRSQNGLVQEGKEVD